MKRSIRVVVLAALFGYILFISFSGRQKSISANEAPLDLLPSSSTCEQLVSHKAFTFCYNEKHEQASWVAYKLTKEMCLVNAVKRSDKFIPDPSVKTGSAESVDYKNSGYDRGHLCPAGDMNWSQLTMEESFYMSNISPQLHTFNAGIWERLENKVRKWAELKGEVFVVAGGVLIDSLPKIGSKNRISVPKYFYKIVHSSAQGKHAMLAFVIENKDWDKTSFYDFTVPVDSVEKLTGIDFFPQMNDTLESRMEKMVMLKGWK